MLRRRTPHQTHTRAHTTHSVHVRNGWRRNIRVNGRNSTSTFKLTVKKNWPSKALFGVLDDVDGKTLFRNVKIIGHAADARTRMYFETAKNEKKTIQQLISARRLGTTHAHTVRRSNGRCATHDNNTLTTLAPARTHAHAHGTHALLLLQRFRRPNLLTQADTPPPPTRHRYIFMIIIIRVVRFDLKQYCCTYPIY